MAFPFYQKEQGPNCNFIKWSFLFLHGHLPCHGRENMKGIFVPVCRQGYAINSKSTPQATCVACYHLRKKRWGKCSLRSAGKYANTFSLWQRQTLHINKSPVQLGIFHSAPSSGDSTLLSYLLVHCMPLVYRLTPSKQTGSV